MKRIFIGIAVFSLFVSCGCAKKEKTAVTIGAITITAEEFESAYQKVAGARPKAMTRKEFLDTMIARKLILHEAEMIGLDKDPQFLESLQIFWEQALLKLVLARKMNELAVGARVSDQEIADYYQRHKDSDFQGKELAQVQGQIKALLLRVKQQLLLQRWTTGLRESAWVNIDYDLLGIPKDK